ncbi:pentapeptide repeat-containing protein [Sanyastnella coralliicola]|uniref:pentapeptide repeat-containing protein n=1 Tax=Sanyastnella coralliicola TaxID=3069118 RepID=UPI0027B89DB6|nr:pentapeptide repeat-containing protein [Longitalea sp. SCSIO 12813]
MSSYTYEEEFKKADFTSTLLAKREYEACTFQNCRFNEADISEMKFIECTFIECDLSNAKVAKSLFQEVEFSACKLVGIQWEHCNDFGFSIQFNNSQLDLATFYQMKLNRCSFVNCQMEGVDLAETSLEGARLSHCKLTNAIFDQTNLQRTDLRGSSGFNIDPEHNKIKGAQFSYPEVLTLLDKYGLKIEQG